MALWKKNLCSIALPKTRLSACLRRQNPKFTSRSFRSPENYNQIYIQMLPRHVRIYFQIAPSLVLSLSYILKTKMYIISLFHN